MRVFASGGVPIGSSSQTVASATISDVLNGLGINNGTVSSNAVGSDLLLAASDLSQIDLDIVDDSGNPVSSQTSGLEFQVSTGTGQKLSVIRPGDTALESSGSIDVGEGDVFEFLLIDDGNEVFFSLAQVDDPTNAAFVRGTATTPGNGNHVVFQNLADSTNTGAPAARLDNIRVGFREVVDVKLEGPGSTTVDGFAIVDDTSGTFGLCRRSY